MPGGICYHQHKTAKIFFAVLLQALEQEKAERNNEGNQPRQEKGVFKT